MRLASTYPPRSGKAAVYGACGALDPAWVLPVQVDAGCNNKALRESPFYLGQRSVQ